MKPDSVENSSSSAILSYGFTSSHFEQEAQIISDNAKIKCINCGREIMMDRLEFKKKLKEVIKDEEI